MADPVITRDPLKLEEIYTLGKLSGFCITITYRDGDRELTTTDIWTLPEAEWMWVEDWMATRQELTGSMIQRATAETGIELTAAKAIVNYEIELCAYTEQ